MRTTWIGYSYEDRHDLMTRTLSERHGWSRSSNIHLGSQQSSKCATEGGSKKANGFFSPDGMVPQLWRAPNSGTNFEMIDAQVLSPLRTHQQDLIVLDGLDF